MAIRIPAGKPAGVLLFRRIRYALRVCRKNCIWFGAAAGKRIATPRRPKVRHAQLRPKARAGQRSLGSPFPTKRAALRGPVVMPAKGQSRATLPWGSSPRKGCRGPMHRFAMTCRRQKRVCGCKGDFPAVHRQCPGMMGPRGKLLHVIARSEATWQSVLLAVAQSETQYFGRIRKALRICPK